MKKNELDEAISKLSSACKANMINISEIFNNVKTAFVNLLPEPNSSKVIGGYQPKTNIKSNPPS